MDISSGSIPQGVITGVDKRYSSPSRKRSSEGQPTRDVSKKRTHAMDILNAVEAEQRNKLAGFEGKNNCLSESSTQGDNKSSPMTDKHRADVSNVTLKRETMKEKAMPSSSLNDKKDSAKVKIPSNMVQYIKEKGRDFNRVKEHFESICLEVTEQYFKENGKLWAGYDPNNKDVPVFVAEVEKRNDKAPENVYGCRLDQRVKEEDVSSAEDSDNNKCKRKVNFAETEIISLCKCMERNTERWLKSHSNILAIMGSDKISHEKQNKTEDMTCVAIYVRNKGIIPFYEEQFKLDNNDFPLDVREGRGVTLVSRLSPEEYSKSVRMGCKIESAYGRGTLTGFLQLPNGKTGCLTAWHLFDTGEGEHTAELLDSDNFNKNVYQPNKQLEEKYKIGKVIRVSEEFDAALIEIDEPDRLPRNGNFPNAVCPEKGYPPSNPMKFDTGDIINCPEELHNKRSCSLVKYGAVTETTFGNYWSIGELYRLKLKNDRGCDLRKPIFVCPELGKAFCTRGDSGAMVFLQDVEIDNKKQEDDKKDDMMQEDDKKDDKMQEDDKKDDKKEKLRAIGMLVSKMDSNGGDFIVVMPIWEILQSFNLPLRLLSFEEPWDIGFDYLQEQIKEVNAKLSTVDQQLAQNTDITRQTYEAVTKFIHQNTNQKR